MKLLFLSHDVDWEKQGAPISHILARKERFSEETLNRLKEKNPYQNVAEMMEIEEEVGVRSTFFFRTKVDEESRPPSYNPQDYKHEIRSMVAGGWEIGLHSDQTSCYDISRLKKEKRELEAVARTQIVGNRVHGTLNDVRIYPTLKKLKFIYDSSVKFCREKIVEDDFGFFKCADVFVFPITFMEALVFAYHTQTEINVLKIVKRMIRMCNGLLTLIWHPCSLTMKFGRKYRTILEYLVSLRNVSILRGIDILGEIIA